jgi:hypothetical protein
MSSGQLTRQLELSQEQRYFGLEGVLDFPFGSLGEAACEVRQTTMALGSLLELALLALTDEALGQRREPLVTACLGFERTLFGRIGGRRR